MDINHIARLITEDPDVYEDENFERAVQAVQKFIDIWSTYAAIDPRVGTPSWEPELVDPDDDEVVATILMIGSKRGVSEKDIQLGREFQPVVEDIVRYINEKTGAKLETGWDWDRGGMLVVGYDLHHLKNTGLDLDAAAEYAKEEEQEQEYDGQTIGREFEHEFMGGITESVDNLRYETLVSDIEHANDVAVREIAAKYVDRPFVQQVIKVLRPEFEYRSGRYGATVVQEPPPWYSPPAKLHKLAEQQGGHFVTIRLADAEREFKVDLYRKLHGYSHPMPGRNVAWASGFLFPDKNLLAIIEIQSDVVRQAPKMMESIRDKVIEGFADWQDNLLQIIIDYATNSDVSILKIPTASKLGRLWRGAGENPNMKVLKSLYDKELRDIAVKEGGWWVIHL